eukprot:CAMPEP_0202701234 /NCGR_PEP_ID=MMETSP1385-20130828/14335_1 /ASSEMBLY_ACC=CAM_ASM_000861 /TAXON_ID=933848 /ORGANISM="Elphidium margaritaceum" /LENGTH=116 /DNA_ID=CAMNT_0049358605 /DNA_START=19 /DNA_END=369 /DNA_ORIENTATION=-
MANANYDKKLPSAATTNVNAVTKNNFQIDMTMDMWEIKLAVKDLVTGNEWFGHYMPKAWTGNEADAQTAHDFFDEELKKEPANWVQIPPFKQNEPLNIIIGDSNGKHYKLALPYKK